MFSDGKGRYAMVRADREKYFIKVMKQPMAAISNFYTLLTYLKVEISVITTTRYSEDILCARAIRSIIKSFCFKNSAVKGLFPGLPVFFRTVNLLTPPKNQY